MAEPAADAIRYKGLIYPIQAWRIIYDYITRRKAPDAEFTRRLAALNVPRTEAYELYRAQMWRPWEIEFIRIAPPEEEWVSDESITGYDIYYNRQTKKYVVRDPKTKDPIRTEDKICLEYTASIKTGPSWKAHEKLVVEITCTTYVEEMGLTDLMRAEKKVEQALLDYLKQTPFANAISGFEKTGVAYNGQNLIEEKRWYPWEVPDFPKVNVQIEKKEKTKRSYPGEFKVEE